MKRIFCILTLTVFALASFDLPLAEAGVLTRGGSNQLNVRVPKIRNRTVKSTTSVMRKPMPQLEFKGKSTVERYGALAKRDRKYDQKYYRWELKKHRIETRAKRREEKRKLALAKKREKEDRAEMRRTKKASPSGDSTSSASVARDPAAWFSSRIAGGDEHRARAAAEAQSDKTLLGSSKEARKTAASKSEDKEARGTDLNVAPVKKKSSFWTHIGRALGLS